MQRVITRDQHRIQVVLKQSNGKTMSTTKDRSLMLLEQHKEAFEYDEALERCMAKLTKLVGLNEIKRFILELYALIKIGHKRRLAGLTAEQQVLHMVFKGNPGTGKTTVARIIGQLFREMGILTEGHLVEVERADLVGEYIGHTAQRTREWVKKAIGGILFIDEAYSLARGGDKDFGKEAIDTLVKALEDFKHQFVLILAGYPLEMEQFLLANPGLPSRFPIQISFPDYTIEELIRIAEMMLKERQYTMTPGAKKQLEKRLKEAIEKPFSNFGNAREVRNIIEQAIRHHAFRLLHTTSPSKRQLMQIEMDDLPIV